jgi:hypothetical protein
MLRRYPEPASYDEIIHNGRFFQQNFLFVLPVALLFILAVFAALLAIAP